jgi:hypothetical protein
MLSSLRGARQSSPAALTSDGAVSEAIVLLQLGDSLNARGVLRQAIDALPVAPTQFLQVEIPAASLPRARLLLAELEHALGDPAAARQHARAAAVLWRNADPDLTPSLRKAERLSSP